MTQATLEKLPFHNSNLFSAYYLSERLPDRSEWDCNEDAREVLDEITDLYELEKDLLPNYKEDALVDSWIDEVLDILGYGTNVETTLPEGDGYVDVLLFEDTETRRDAAGVYLDTNDTTDLFEGGLSLLEAKQWDADFSKRFSENRPYYNASQQIRRYLDKTPSNIEWGILTNGRKWRLYGTKYHEAQIYYEVDLPELIENGNLDRFKYFYLFFRPGAFRTTSGSTFLDSVWSESETATQELGDDLQDNVFRALRVLGHGIVETNDLNIDHDDDEKLSELKEQSLVLLYRLMFVLYAESRQLIDPEGKQAQKEYEQNFSLNQHRLDIHDTIGEVDTGFEDEYSTYSTSIWSNLQDLFRLVDQGKESLGIPPYNGGLFDHDEHAFLTEHQVSDRHLAEVIYRLSTTENDEGRYVLADYGDLDTRHLGSVYEGLLEHQFRIAPEDYAAVAEDGGQVWKPATEVSTDAVETVDEGSLYVTNDEGERKATGAYYTPDYVVNYIVEETIAPLVDDIRENLVEQGFETGTQEYLGAFLRRVTQLKILDPAMGSGHFLTGATGYLAEQVMKEVREVESEMGVAFNEQHVRREIAKECIYGVDINGMAVELAKLSMWLETLAADRPLAFLDHHLKAGNSLVGSNITEVLSEDSEDTRGQLTLTQSFARARQQTLSHVMELMSDLLEIDNEKLEDIKSMEELYGEIRDDPLYQRLFEVTNVHTAQQFGLDVPDGVYEDMAMAIDDASEWADIQEEDWFNSAQEVADKQGFFHWELEYPEVFFDDDGEKLDGAGFDAVVGNPPWVRSINLKQSNKANWRYLKENYNSASSGEYDIYLCFIESGLSLISDGGEFGFITPNKWFTSNVGGNLRGILSEGNYVTEIVDFGSYQLFEGITTYSCLLFLNKQNTTGINVSELTGFERDTDPEVGTDEFWQKGTIDSDSLTSESWSFNIGPIGKLFDKLDTLPALGDHANIFKGVGTNADTVYLLKNATDGFYSKELDETIELEDDILRPALKGNDIHSYHYDKEHRLLFPYEFHNGDTELISENKLKESYPQTWNYLQRVQETLESRESGKYRGDEDWYRFGRPQNMKLLGQEKAVLPDVVNESTLAYDNEGRYILDTAYGIVSDTYNDKYLTAILNSDLLTVFLHLTGTDLRGGYFRMKTAYLNPFPIPNLNFTTSDSERELRVSELQTAYQNYVENGTNKMVPNDDGVAHDFLVNIVENITNLEERLNSLNLSLLDHLGSYSDGPTLADIGLTQPPSGSADSILQQTATEKPNLRVGEPSVIRESDTTVDIRLTARYKPSEDEDLDEANYETDQWGYTETGPQPALRITDLTETEADLIEAFVPVAVEEAGGFADFRETATKTNSLVDRLRKLTLPSLSDVEAGLESYTQTKERADKLETKIERTDDLIAEIVYDLYGLTDEEIEIVEEAVSK